MGSYTIVAVAIVSSILYHEAGVVGHFESSHPPQQLCPVKEEMEINSGCRDTGLAAQSTEGSKLLQAWAAQSSREQTASTLSEHKAGKRTILYFSSILQEKNTSGSLQYKEPIPAAFLKIEISDFSNSPTYIHTFSPQQRKLTFFQRTLGPVLPV